MMASSKTESNITPDKFQRSISPSGCFCSSSSSSSPNRNSVDHHGNSVSSSPSVCFSIDHRSGNSPGHSIASSSSPRERNQNQNQNQSSGSNHRNSNKAWSSNGQKKKCMCSPTTHPGSFRCSLHRNVSSARSANQSSNNAVSIPHQSSHRSYARRSAMANSSLVRIGTAEGDLVKRSLASLIRPSSHQQRRRCDFQPKPSRLSVMSKADAS